MMKKNYFNLILIFGIIVIVSSCAKDETTPDTPGADRDKYVGSWSCKETQGASFTTFTITIQKSGNDDTLLVYNFDNLGSNEKAIFIVSESSVVIPAQNVGTSPSFFVSGSGTYSSGKINLEYTVDNDTYTAVCSK
jgi:hypothetical protein